MTRAEKDIIHFALSRYERQLMQDIMSRWVKTKGTKASVVAEMAKMEKVISNIWQEVERM